MSEPGRKPLPAETAINKLSSAGLLPPRQAEAYVLREIKPTPNYAVAESMGVDDSTVSQYVTEAQNKIDAAEATLAALDEVRRRLVPDECEECGTSLSDRWATGQDGRALCFDCAGADR